jgi:hypothetical protein
MHTHSTKDGRITLHHNADWSGDVDVVVSSGDGTNYGGSIRASLLLCGDFDAARSGLSGIPERFIRRASVFAVYVYLTGEIQDRIESLVDSIPLKGVV